MATNNLLTLGHESITPDLEETWRKSLFDAGRRIGEANVNENIMLTEPIINLVFALCDQLNVSSYIRFACLDNLDRFALTYYEENIKLGPPNGMSTYLEKFPLYFATILTLVFKFFDNYIEFDAQKMINYLNTIDFKVSSAEIREAEYQVLRCLQFKVKRMQIQ